MSKLHPHNKKKIKNKNREENKLLIFVSNKLLIIPFSIEYHFLFALLIWLSYHEKYLLNSAVPIFPQNPPIGNNLMCN